MDNKKILELIKGKLIVSCQALENEPLYTEEGNIMPLMAKAAVQSGAAGIRANGVRDISQIKKVVDVPVIGIIKKTYPNTEAYITPSIDEVDQLVKIGYVFLTFGLLFGALWAKEAWGHYWTWDPKETWAFITWLGYLVYLHHKYNHKEKKPFQSFLIVGIAFILLLVCWFGVNYLPTAQMSVHTYSG